MIVRFVQVAAVLALGGLLAGTETAAPAPDSRTSQQDTAAEAIRALLERSVEAWNRGDLNAFMAGYAKGGRLRFAANGRVYRGWHAALERYRRRYGDDRESMGRLAFEDVEVTRMGPDGAVAFGRYRLVQDETASEGLFTLTLKKMDGHWRIIHDHTSTARGQ